MQILAFGSLLLAAMLLAGDGLAQSSRETSRASADAVAHPWPRARVGEAIPDLAHACLPTGRTITTTAPQADIAASLRTIGVSPVGAWLIEQATIHAVVICNDPATDLAAYYRAQMRLIGLLQGLGEAAKVVFLAHELAHVPQHPRYSNNRRFGPQAMIVLHRLREATAEAVATRVLWQLRQSDHGEPWAYKLRTSYGDIARAFARRMAETDDELAATRAAFDQWFGDPRRVDGYDARILDHLARITDDRTGLVRTSRHLTERFLRAIGHHAGETFLPPDRGLAVTAPDERVSLSPRNSARLGAILEHAMWSEARRG